MIGQRRTGGLARGWLAIAVALAAFVVSSGLVGVLPASAALAAYGYDTADYTYDAPVLLSSPDTAAAYARGSPSGPGVVSWVSAAFVRGDVVAANTAGLEARVAGVHGVLDPIAQTSRTTAALGTREGTTVIGGGVRDLSPAQRALIGDGEMMAGGPGHAEVTTVLGARGAGLTPQGIVTSWDICPTCQTFLQNEGATLTGPRSAGW